MSEKTEQPTDKKKADARRKGQGVGRSHELAMGLTLGASVLGVMVMLPAAAGSLSATLRATIQSIADGPASGGALTGSVGSALSQWLGIVLPLGLAVGLVGAIANVVSGGLVLSVHTIRFDPSRMNLLKGLPRLVDKQALVRLGIASAKLAILAGVSWMVATSAIPRMLTMEGAGIETIGAVALDALLRLGMSITLPVAVLSAVDFIIQRRRARGQIRMTKDEVKREMREQDGDPLVRSARRRRARQIAMQRMMQAVPSADVVVTNPTHLAVALKYDSLTMKAPRIVAKGQRLMAQRIKKLAKEHGVPVIEDKPLARALFPRPLNSEIPAHLYAVVARILVMVQQTRFGLRRTAPRPTATGSATGAAAAYRPSTPRSGPATGDLA